MIDFNIIALKWPQVFLALSENFENVCNDYEVALTVLLCVLA